MTTRAAQRDTKEQARNALMLLDPEQEQIVRMAYGFTTGRPMTDIEIAIELNIPRSTVQWVRTRALNVMREGLGGQHE